MDRRTEQMERVASQIEAIVKENGRRNDIAITYCEMDAESLNDFTKVYNYHQLGPDDSDYSVEQAIAYAHSQKAVTFIRTFIKDLNGNVSKDSTTGIEQATNEYHGE